MVKGAEVLRYTAFSDNPEGGNPAGIVLDANGLDNAAMLDIAHQVGYSETAFLWPLPGSGNYRLRYFSPVAEVPFCGHATIASAVALADHAPATSYVFTHRRRESPDVFHSRVPFPVGGVVEDPATGAAAAALGAYLRQLGLVHPPAAITIHQGDDMGRPSLLRVEIDPGRDGIRVSGNAVPIPS
jgi:predicted PhzF superfamily epimerase YddE/YHI9